MRTHWAKASFLFGFLFSLYFLLAIFFASVLNYDFMRSDVLLYWNESLAWMTPFNEHPPLYTLAIALARGLTFNLLDPVLLMMGLNLLSFLGCAWLLMKFFKRAGLKQEYAAWGVLLFALWPLVGLTYTVVPLADIPSILLALIGILMLQKARHPLAGLFFGLAIVAHKGVWPIIGLVALADFYTRKKYFSKRNLAFVAIMLLPLSALWLAGIPYHQSINWFMESSLEVNTSLGGGYPILDGLFGTFQEGGLKNWVKGAVILFFILLTLFSLFVSLKLRFKYYELCVAISLAVLIMFLFSSAATIWGPVRFSRFLVFPLIFFFNAHHGLQISKRVSFSLGAIAVFVLFISQLAYAWYIAFVFFA